VGNKPGAILRRGRFLALISSDPELESLMEDLVTPAILTPSESHDYVHSDDPSVEPDPQFARAPSDAALDPASGESAASAQATAASAQESDPSSTLSAEGQAEPNRIKDLPREVGVMLFTVGVLGFVLPGVVGTPAMIAGGLVLWPKAFNKVDNWFERRFPKIHKQSLYQINRYLNDLEMRYPGAIQRDYSTPGK
jgi:hypothetical protein